MSKGNHVRRAKVKPYRVQQPNQQVWDRMAGDFADLMSKIDRLIAEGNAVGGIQVNLDTGEVFAVEEEGL